MVAGNTMNVGSLSALGTGDYLLLMNISDEIGGSFACGVTIGRAGMAASILTTVNAVLLVVAAVERGGRDFDKPLVCGARIDEHEPDDHHNQPVTDERASPDATPVNGAEGSIRH